MKAPPYASSVFINCPFDEPYLPVFRALVFTVFDCGFVARCAQEIDDSGQVRIDKIARIIEECRYGIHDISRVELDSGSRLPRFNMPLELGMFLGAKRFGDGEQAKKNCLILDAEKYRYQIFMSDIAGQDIQTHSGRPEYAIKVVRNWLSIASRRKTLPGGAEVYRRYLVFQADLPLLCRRLRLVSHDLIFNDYATIVSEWLGQNP